MARPEWMEGAPNPISSVLVANREKLLAVSFVHVKKWK